MKFDDEIEFSSVESVFSFNLGKMLENPESEGPGTKMNCDFSARFGNSLIISPSALNSFRNDDDDEVVPWEPDKKLPMSMKQIGGTSQ